ncbi:O(6)-methylguanine-induced apoptosis 2 [Gastrophryne carolinensis]
MQKKLIEGEPCLPRGNSDECCLFYALSFFNSNLVCFYFLLSLNEYYILAKQGFKIPTGPASIPMKYQTVFIAESENKGFNSGALRFSHSFNQNENPGPGSYNISKGPDINSASLSAKGTGGFPSKVPRSSSFKANHTPAPNTYYIKNVFSKNDFNTSNSSMFHHPIATYIEDCKNQTPAPNQYNASVNYCYPGNNVSAHAAFVSRTKRDPVQLNTFKAPSPCHYTVNDSLVKESSKTLVSSFKSKTTRDILNVTSNNPGPATYDPYGTSAIGKNAVLQRKHYLCFSAPAIPVPKTPGVPGPGNYDLVNYEGPPKQYISSAVFVSNTSRWTGDASGVDLPGPGAYDPKFHGKQSFLYNIEKKWIPA